MKRLFILFLFTSSLCIYCVYAQVVFENAKQRWEVVSIESNDDVTAIFCDITILDNSAGCFDAHKYDSKGAEIYLYGDFGRLKLLDSYFEGNYRPWNRYEGLIYWNYYRASKGKIAHAMFVFPRVPVGVESINWYFRGGIANREGTHKNYSCPIFQAQNLPIRNNTDNHKTDWTEQKLRTYWQEHTPLPVEGIYSFVGTSNPVYWGTSRHRLAVIHTENIYKVIYLGGANESVWHIGDLKATFSPTTTKGLYKVNNWLLENKTSSPADFYLEYNERYITLYDSKSYVETRFMKLYPEYDITIGTDHILDSKETNRVKGNGSGFFVGGNIVATNYHVVKEASRLTIVVNSSNGSHKYSTKVLCVDRVNDLALLTIDEADFSPLLSLPYTISSKLIDVGTYIFTMGYPMEHIMGTEIKITDGIISSKTGYQNDVVTYQISAPIQPGSSGGPMFDSQGILVGVTSAGIPVANNVGYAIKSGYLLNLIESAPISIVNIGSNTLNGKSLPEKIKALAPYVVTILVY